MPQLVAGLTVEGVRRNLGEVREEIAAAAHRAGREPGEVEIVAATKYVALEDLPILAEAGVTIVGENRAQELQAKHAAHGPRFTWDFIGALQSRKVRAVAPLVRRIHSLASTSALAQLERQAGGGATAPEVLVEVNVAGQEGKAGVAPGELEGLLAEATVPVVGLMTMPPLATRPEDNRRWFAALCELAATHGLPHLSMGTTQDFAVAVEEGATLVRVGTRLYRP